VRLGDQNLRKTDDGADPVDYNIKRFIKHENYKKSLKENDIALIELVTSVNFTKFIRPACLKQDDIGIEKVIAVIRKNCRIFLSFLEILVLCRLAGDKVEHLKIKLMNL
jgi:hypothetical protein